ncbi:calmodulin-A-like [Ruditapes philippinarum]|uniref:calmodulin-A-like n=1 Tax=Ruditapes philippinarum TaxID=129788 RepID=UPI00295AF989|nr:calmodulin-A-like [Ruditapes philippinarum]
MANKKFTDEQLQEFKEAFHLFDKDGDNTITTPELLTVMKSLGHNPSRDDIIEMIKEVDSNGNGKIEFSEFLTLMEKNMSSFESEDLIKGAFSVIDPHGEGYITLQGLRQVVHDLGLDFTDEEMRDMIEEADPTGDGRVNLEDFVKMMTSSQ